MAQLQARPGVAAILRDSTGAVLLHRRRVGDGWAPPSGAVEPGESLLDALRRELREETALEVGVERLIGIYSDPAYQIVRYPNGQEIHFVTCLFACRPREGELRGSDEGLEWRWFPSDALPSGLLPYAKIWLADGQVNADTVLVR